MTALDRHLRIADLEARNGHLAGLVAKLAAAMAVSASTDDPGVVTLTPDEAATVDWPFDAAVLRVEVEGPDGLPRPVSSTLRHDLIVARDRADLAEGILRKLKFDADTEVCEYGPKHAMAGSRFLGLDYSAVDLTDAEAALFDTITEEST